MRRIRIGNDIQVSVNVNMGEDTLVGKNIQVYLNSQFGSELLTGYKVEGSKIIIELPGSKNKVCGSYFITLVLVSESSLHTIDSDEEWKLVDNTEMSDKKNSSFNKKEFITITL